MAVKPIYPSLFVNNAWVALAAVVNRAGHNTALPLLFRLTPEAGNHSKLKTARLLVRALLQQFKDRAVTVLVDSWYMKHHLSNPHKTII